MKERERKLIEFAKVFGNKFPTMKHILRPFYHKLFIDRVLRKKNQKFNNNALELLQRFDNCLTVNGFKYCLGFGTLLGAIREGGFITHDNDLDVFMWYSEYSDELQEKLESYGFKLAHSFLIDEGVLGREDTYTYKSVAIDIFYIYEAVDLYPYCCDFLPALGYPTIKTSMDNVGYVMPRRIEFPITYEFSKIDFEGVEFPIPTNADEILQCIYGESYLIPDPKWTASNNKYCFPWDGKQAIYIEYN